MTKKEILSLLKGTKVEDEITFLRKTYEELKKKEEKFCNKLCIKCDDGCGKCCEHFTPDISSLESDYLAFGLITENKDEEFLKILENYDPKSKQCPFYNIDNPSAHCMVYSYRPLICRLFGQSVVKDKNNLPSYRECKYKEHKHDITKEMLEANERIMVYMQDYGLKIDEYDEFGGRTEMIYESLIKSIYKIRLMIELCEEQNK